MYDLNKTNRIKTFGYSMYPLLHDGDIVYFERINFDQIHENDIVVIRSQGQYIVHRIVYKMTNFFVSKGDNTQIADTITDSQSIVGRVYKIKRLKEVIQIDDFYLIQSSYYAHELKSIYKSLNNDKSEIVILKGLPVVFYYTKQHPKRVYADCDLLVSCSGLLQKNIFQIFKKHHYEDLNTSHVNQEKYIEKSYGKFLNNFPIVFDIHSEPVFLMIQFDVADVLYSRSLLNEMTQEFIDEKRDISVFGMNCHILAPHHLIVYLCLHFFHHNYQGIFRLSFIDSVIKKESFEYPKLWDDIVLFMNKYQLHIFLYPVFRLLNQYYDLKIPQHVLKKTYTFRGWCVYQMVKRRIFHDDSRRKAGIIRFILVVLLSPVPFYKKFKIMIDTRIWKALIWTISL